MTSIPSLPVHVVTVIPSVTPDRFKMVQNLAHTLGMPYTLGIHPMMVEPLELDRGISELSNALANALDDPFFVGIGEIGLDFFGKKSLDIRAKQWEFFTEQLKLAKQFNLPVLLHVRQAVDQIIVGLRQYGVNGIAHAFNGSFQQAHRLLDLGCKLGFGGAVTFPRATHLQKLVKGLPVDSIVLETDSPDMPPVWLAQANRLALQPQPNSPHQLELIAKFIAEFLEVDHLEFNCQMWRNSISILPKLAQIPLVCADEN